MEFQYNSAVAFYLKAGWKLVSPTRHLCPACQSTLLHNILFEFMFCVPCQAKILQDGDRLVAVTRYDEQAALEAQND